MMLAARHTARGASAAAAAAARARLSSAAAAAAAASPASAPASSLRDAVESAVPGMREKLKAVKAKHASKPLGEVTVRMAVGGMRGIKGMVCETSALDPEEGIRFRGYTIPELQAKLPKAENGGSEPLPEGILWLLLTGNIPSVAEVRDLSAELESRAELPADTVAAINAFPDSMHAMTQLTSAVLSMQPGSKFSAAYQRHEVNKSNAWDFAFEDSLTIIARLPRIAAMIYNNKFHSRRATPEPAQGLDWAANYGRMMGFSDPKFDELMRLYLTIHTDHEGGNASAHATHLVGSTLADPYLSFAAGMTALAGPLHGLANQEVLQWTLEMREKLAGEMSADRITQYCWDTLNSGQVIPGFGHAVLRKTDPRYTSQREFAMKHLPDDELFKLVSSLYDIVPQVLTEHGKTANPWPNVDAHSGVLLQHYGLTQPDYYTVLFGVSRAIGVLSQLVISRAMGLPLERPKSLTLNEIDAMFSK